MNLSDFSRNNGKNMLKFFTPGEGSDNKFFTIEMKNENGKNRKYVRETSTRGVINGESNYKYKQKHVTVQIN